MRIEIDQAKRVKRVVPFQIARPGEAQPEPAEAQTSIAISREKSEKPVTLDPEADLFLLPELYHSSSTLLQSLSPAGSSSAHDAGISQK